MTTIKDIENRVGITLMHFWFVRFVLETNSNFAMMSGITTDGIDATSELSFELMKYGFSHSVGSRGGKAKYRSGVPDKNGEVSDGAIMIFPRSRTGKFTTADIEDLQRVKTLADSRALHIHGDEDKRDVVIQSAGLVFKEWFEVEGIRFWFFSQDYSHNTDSKAR